MDEEKVVCPRCGEVLAIEDEGQVPTVFILKEPSGEKEEVNAYTCPKCHLIFFESQVRTEE